MRVGLFKPVHVKTLAAQEQRMLLTSRKLVQRKLIDIECDMRGTPRNFGLKVGVVSAIGYEARIRHLVEGFPRLAANTPATPGGALMKKIGRQPMPPIFASISAPPTIGAAIAPWAIRARTRCSASSASPHATELSAKPLMPIRNIRR
jgi:hypothetical protein